MDGAVEPCNSSVFLVHGRRSNNPQERDSPKVAGFRLSPKDTTVLFVVCPAIISSSVFQATCWSFSCSCVAVHGCVRVCVCGHLWAWACSRPIATTSRWLSGINEQTRCSSIWFPNENGSPATPDGLCTNLTSTRILNPIHLSAFDAILCERDDSKKRWALLKQIHRLGCLSNLRMSLPARILLSDEVRPCIRAFVKKTAHHTQRVLCACLGALS